MSRVAADLAFFVAGLCCGTVQYYNFIRFGKAGYRRMFDNLFAVCCHLAAKLEETGGSGLAAVCG